MLYISISTLLGEISRAWICDQGGVEFFSTELLTVCRARDVHVYPWILLRTLKGGTTMTDITDLGRLMLLAHVK